MSEKERSIVRDMLIEIDRVCGAAGIDYFLYAGSLLGNKCDFPFWSLDRVSLFSGQHRNEDMIPWDDDMDVAIKVEHMDAFRKEITKARQLFWIVDLEWISGISANLGWRPEDVVHQAESVQAILKSNNVAVGYFFHRYL